MDGTRINHVNEYLSAA